MRPYARKIMPSPPLHDLPPVPAPARRGLDSPPPREIASHTRGHILSLSGLALRAQANSLPGLACHLLAGSRSGGN